jgi:ATP-dependent exoDNAse (exonuclease V) alpha subunit
MRVLVSKDMTQAQSKSSLSYQPGDVIQAQRKYESLGIKAGETATVVLSSGGRVQIERQDGVIVEWRPALMPHFSAFTVAEREIAVGETLRVTANDYFRELVNGERVTVAEINRRQGLLYINKANGARLTVNIDRPLHIEHGYCSTIHSAQGQTCERVIIEADARSATAHEASYYVALSRARSEVALYTDDRALLPQAMARESSKTTALSLARAGSQESALER